MGERIPSRSIGIIRSLVYKALNSWPSRLKLLVSFAALLAGLLFGYIVPLIFGWIVDSMSATVANNNMLVLLTVAYAGSWMFSRTIRMVAEEIVHRLILFAVRDYSTDFLKHLVHMPSSFWTSTKTGAVVESLFRSQDAVMRICWNIVFLVVIAIVEVATSSLIAFCKYGFMFGAIFLSSVLLYLAFNHKAVSWFNKEQITLNQRRMAVGARVNDLLSNWEAIRVFGNMNHEVSRLHIQFDEQGKALADFYYRTQLLTSVQEVILSAGLFSMTILSAYWVTIGRLTIGEFTTINAYLLQLIYPLKELGRAQMEFRQAINDLDNTSDIICSELLPHPRIEQIQFDRPEVAFNNVTFYYPNTKIPALKNLNFRVDPGSTLGIVGTTGSGKSTIVKLLCRLYDLDLPNLETNKNASGGGSGRVESRSHGSILVNGQSISDLDSETLSQNIALVCQEALLFDETIGYNVRYGNIAASDSEVWSAIDNAGLKDFILSLPEGLETKIGQRGVVLSGGEKQRISIARALLKNPAIYIFDEATSALDYTTQAQINQNIRRLTAGKTNFVIAHRLALVADADNIIVLHKGSIVEHGTHEQLLSNEDSLYHEMFLNQGGYSTSPSRPIASKP